MNIDTDKASRIATMLIGLVTLFFAYKTSTWDDRLKSIEVNDKTVKFSQDQMAFDRDFKLKIYQLALEAIKSKDTAQQQAAYIVVNTMVPDTAFKVGLLGLFVKSKTVAPDIRKAATVANFDITESAKSNPIYSITNKLRVEIFYIPGPDGTQAIAEKIYNALKSSDYYQVNLKVLTDRQKSDLQVKANEVRHDPTAEETAKAAKLTDIVNQILIDSDIVFTSKATTGTHPTKGYLSLFVTDLTGKNVSDPVIYKR